MLNMLQTISLCAELVEIMNLCPQDMKNVAHQCTSDPVLYSLSV